MRRSGGRRQGYPVARGGRASTRLGHAADRRPLFPSQQSMPQQQWQAPLGNRAASASPAGARAPVVSARQQVVPQPHQVQALAGDGAGEEDGRQRIGVHVPTGGHNVVQRPHQEGSLAAHAGGQEAGSRGEKGTRVRGRRETGRGRDEGQGPQVTGPPHQPSCERPPAARAGRPAGPHRTPGLRRMAPSVCSVCLSTCSGARSTFVTTKNTGTCVWCVWWEAAAAEEVGENAGAPESKAPLGDSRQGRHAGHTRRSAAPAAAVLPRSCVRAPPPGAQPAPSAQRAP